MLYKAGVFVYVRRVWLGQTSCEVVRIRFYKQTKVTATISQGTYSCQIYMSAMFLSWNGQVHLSGNSSCYPTNKLFKVKLIVYNYSGG